MPAILTSDDGHVRTIRLNRPEAKNALNDELAWGIVGAIEAAAADDNVWVIGITGSGDSFCAGLDLKGMGDSHNPLSPMTQQLDDLAWISHFPVGMRMRCEKPIVAGINGVAVGGGLSLALAADVRIMARGARILAGYRRIGGSPDGGMTWTLVQSIGYEQTMRFLLENRTVDADEALRLGIVGEVVDDGAFESRFSAYCQQLASISPITTRLTKRTVGKATTEIDLEAQLRLEIASISPITTRLTKRTVGKATTEIDLEAQLRLEIASIGRAFASEDGIEARRAFLEKRTPVFKGK